MRVAYLVGYHPAVSQTFIDREVRALRADGVEVAICSLRRAPGDQLTGAEEPAAFVVQEPRAGRLLRAGLRAIGRPGRLLGALRTARRIAPPGARAAVWHLLYLAEAVLLLDELRRRRIRHVHAHFANSASLVALLAAELGGPRTSWSFTMHGPTEFDDVTAYALAEKVRRAAFVACIGDYCRSQLMKLVEPEHWERLRIVRCGVDVDAAPPAAETGEPLGVDAPLRLLCVGRLVPDKGQRLLLEALHALRGGGTAAELDLVGDGPDRAALEARAAALGLGEVVRFHGSVAPDRVPGFLAEADVFCLPSFAEGIPVSLMEAMAAGVVVLTTRIAGIPELVHDGEGGILVPPGRIDALEAALGRLAADGALRGRLGAAGRATVAAEFDVTRSAARLREAFVDAFAGAARG